MYNLEATTMLNCGILKCCGSRKNDEYFFKNTVTVFNGCRSAQVVRTHHSYDNKITIPQSLL